ncbi:hypothetical protein ACFY4C_35420 [Actinomadura viridis]|uniref:hypothetical protein n=1 Tax=Actinomadura viridis TaxID=58110 RepID=UPI0036786DE4
MSVQAVALDLEQVLTELRRRFPRVIAWWGQATGHWWALTLDHRGRDRLLEAPDPAALCRILEEVRQTPAPPPTWFARSAVMTGTVALLPGSRASASSDPRPSPRHARSVHGRDRRGWWRRLLGTLVVLE